MVRSAPLPYIQMHTYVYCFILDFGSQQSASIREPTYNLKERDVFQQCTASLNNLTYVHLFSVREERRTIDEMYTYVDKESLRKFPKRNIVIRNSWPPLVQRQ